MVADQFSFILQGFLRRWSRFDSRDVGHQALKMVELHAGTFVPNRRLHVCVGDSELIAGEIGAAAGICSEKLTAR